MRLRGCVVHVHARFFYVTRVWPSWFRYHELDVGISSFEMAKMRVSIIWSNEFLYI